MVKKFTIVFIFILLILIFSAHKSYAVFDCLILNNSSTQTDKDFCRNELTQIEAQLADLLNKQQEQQKQTGTLKGDVTALTIQINILKTKIKARSLKIAQLKVDIKDKVTQIKTLSEKIDREHESLAQLLRNTNNFDNQNFIYLMFSDENLSTFYSDIESFNSIKQAIKTSVDIINGVKVQTETVKTSLEKQQNAETDAKAELESTQKQVVKSETNKKQLLAISKNKEAEYQKLADEKKVMANKIRSALFSLAGISEKIKFGTALQYANEAKNKTGIDPAFLLAILTQESNLGSNVGKCNIPNTQSWDKIMPGPAEYQVYLNNRKTCKNSKFPCSSRDDQTPFQNIVENLGINPYSVALSCPIKSAGPWGGAMGPAQVIPSTWKSLENNLKVLLGYYGNPWSPRDAFMASAIYLTNLGAVGISTSAQNRAACSYYGTGGSTCSYSRSVMKYKATIQNNIDLLSS